MERKLTDNQDFRARRRRARWTAAGLFAVALLIFLVFLLTRMMNG